MKKTERIKNDVTRNEICLRALNMSLFLLVQVPRYCEICLKTKYPSSHHRNGADYFSIDTPWLKGCQQENKINLLSDSYPSIKKN